MCSRGVVCCGKQERRSRVAVCAKKIWKKGRWWFNPERSNSRMTNRCRPNRAVSLAPSCWLHNQSAQAIKKSKAKSTAKNTNKTSLFHTVNQSDGLLFSLQPKKRAGNDVNRQRERERGEKWEERATSEKNLAENGSLSRTGRRCVSMTRHNKTSSRIPIRFGASRSRMAKRHRGWVWGWRFPLMQQRVNAACLTMTSKAGFYSEQLVVTKVFFLNLCDIIR